MKKTTWFFLALTFLAGAFTVLPKVLSQDGPQGRVVRVELKNGKSFPISEEAAQKITEAIKSTDREKKKPQAETRAPSLKQVDDLVKQFKLNVPTPPNQDLTFGDNEIAYWFGRKLDESDLKLEFLARRIVLDAADKQNVAIRDQDMLSDATNQVVAAIKGGTNTKGSTPASGGQQRNVDVKGLICKGTTSQELIKQAWDALEAGKGGRGHDNFEKALACAGIVIDKWGDEADEQQVKRQNSGDCKKTPTAAEKDAYFRDYWALSDIAAAWFIRGQAYTQLRMCSEAKESFEVVNKKYNCAYTWDPQGWFWNTAKGSTLESKHCP